MLLSRRVFFRLGVAGLITLFTPGTAYGIINHMGERSRTLAHKILSFESVIGSNRSHLQKLDDIIRSSLHNIPREIEEQEKAEKTCEGIEIALEKLGYSYGKHQTLSEALEKKIIGPNNFSVVAYSVGELSDQPISLVEMNHNLWVRLSDNPYPLYYNIQLRGRKVTHDMLNKLGNPKQLSYEEIIGRSFVFIAASSIMHKKEFLDKAIDYYPCPSHYYFRSLYFMEQGNLDSALSDIDTALAKNGVDLSTVELDTLTAQEASDACESIEYLTTKGQIHLYREEHLKALECFDKILHIQPNISTVVNLKEVTILDRYISEYNP
jgi:hypothetical protein